MNGVEWRCVYGTLFFYLSLHIRHSIFRRGIWIFLHWHRVWKKAWEMRNVLLSVASRNPEKKGKEKKRIKIKFSSFQFRQTETQYLPAKCHYHKDWRDDEANGRLLCHHRAPNKITNSSPIRNMCGWALWFGGWCKARLY